MLNRALAVLLTLAFLLPFFLVGIVVTGVLLLALLGIGPHDKSMAFALLFLLLVPFGIFAFGFVGYALLVAALRATGLQSWYERNVPPGKPSRLDAPFKWVRCAIHRLMPGSLPEA